MFVCENLWSFLSIPLNSLCYSDPNILNKNFGISWADIWWFYDRNVQSVSAGDGLRCRLKEPLKLNQSTFLTWIQTKGRLSSAQPAALIIYHFWMSSFSCALVHRQPDSPLGRISFREVASTARVYAGTASQVFNYKPCLCPNMLPVTQHLCSEICWDTSVFL